MIYWWIYRIRKLRYNNTLPSAKYVVLITMIKHNIEERKRQKYVTLARGRLEPCGLPGVYRQREKTLPEISALRRWMVSQHVSPMIRETVDRSYANCHRTVIISTCSSNTIDPRGRTVVDETVNQGKRNASLAIYVLRHTSFRSLTPTTLGRHQLPFLQRASPTLIPFSSCQPSHPRLPWSNARRDQQPPRRGTNVFAVPSTPATADWSRAVSTIVPVLLKDRT